MIQNQFISIVRTYVPIGVGAVLAWVAIHFGFTVDEKTQTTLVLLVTALLQAGYYLIVRALEAKWPRLGVLLGVPAKPHYPRLVKDDRGATDVAVILLVAVLVIVVILLFHGPIH